MSLWDRVGSLYDRAASSPRIAALVIAAVVVAAMLYQTRGPSDRERVEAYCAYGAKSAAQWFGCVDHVTIEKVRAMGTPAARFALDGGTCPQSTFCERWQEFRSYCDAAVESSERRSCRVALAAGRGTPQAERPSSGYYGSP